MEIKNKKASFDYEFLETFVSGIVLCGTEIKSLRQNGASINESFCYFIGKELFLKGSYIAKYKYNGYINHEETRDRKLLLTKKELSKLFEKSKERGLTIVPYKLFINERGLCKVCIALAKGKKEYDKRNTIKERDSKRELDRIKKQY